MHTDVWRATDAFGSEKVVPSGHDVLDRELPGGGWPQGSLVEVLQCGRGRHEWQLVLPGLVATQGPVVLVAGPHEPFGPSLEAQGLPMSRLLRVEADKPAARLWACEQALKCREVAAVLGWLPRVKSAELRRLHLAAAQHAKLLFVFRPAIARDESSPARVRLLLEEGEGLRVRLVKRRGPPIAHALQLRAHPPRLQALLEARRRGAVPLVEPLTETTPEGRSHVLDRTAAHA